MRSSEGFVFVRRGLHLYYHVLGDGKETVVIPNANWLSELLLPLAEGRRLILYDPRSRGRSSAVTDSRHLSLEDDAEDLEAVRRYFSLEKMALLGSSYHAAITALYALENPERVERMLLVSPITPRRPGEWVQETPTPEELAFPPGIPRLEEMRREGLDRDDPVAYCRAWFNYFLLPAQMSELAAASRFPLDDVCSFPNEWPQHTMNLYFGHIIPKMEDWDFRPRLSALPAPLLVMQGTDDLVPMEASREWAAWAGNGRSLMIDGAGSHPYIERPKVFFPAADAFFKGGWPRGSEPVPRVLVP
jgi:pimeloyl-ACP methyl ester carboxylesterase